MTCAKTCTQTILTIFLALSAVQITMCITERKQLSTISLVALHTKIIRYFG